MQVLSSCPVSSSASSSMPTPSSTEAIIAARSRISSCVPTCIASRKARLAGSSRSSNISRQAGFLLQHFVERQHVGPRRIVAPW